MFIYVLITIVLFLYHFCIGRQFKVEIIRNGEVIRVAMDIDNFSYDGATSQMYVSLFSPQYRDRKIN